MTFNRPYLVPEIFKDAIVDLRRSIAEERLKASDFIEIFINSSVEEEDGEGMRINDYHLTRFTEMAIDIQIMFNDPSKISSIITEPDRLIVRLQRSSKFE